MALRNRQPRSNEEWVAALRGTLGDENQQQAYGDLGKWLHIQLFNYLRKMRSQQRAAKRIDDSELETAAEVLVQTVLLKVHEKRLYDQYSGKNGAQFTSFITGIALRTAIDFMRKEWRYEFVSIESSDASESQEPSSLPEQIDFASPNPETEQLLQEFWQDFRACVATLDNNRQLVFLWRGQDELSFDEIAERLKKTKNAVSQLFFHARAKIRDCLISKQWSMNDIGQALAQAR